MKGKNNNNTNIKEWKIQHNKGNSSIGQLYLMPLFSNKPNRGPLHRFITTFNLIMASSFALITTELTLKGYTGIQVTNVNDYGMYHIIQDFIIAVIFQSVIEYYWHRLMHIPFFYKYMHKYHHYYKSPEVYDDLYIHPIEAFGYYCILYGPPFVMQSLHLYSFILYMVVMGLCGVLDHSGVRVKIFSIYNTSDHDRHHSHFDVNYAFPFPFMDMIHGTYIRGS